MKNKQTLGEIIAELKDDIARFGLKLVEADRKEIKQIILNDKSYGSKGCENCRVIAERYRKRHGISMEEAWKLVWKESGINMKIKEETLKV